MAWFSACLAPAMLRAPSFTRPRLRMLNATLWPFADRAEHVADRHLHVVEHQRRRGRAVESELLLVGAADHAHVPLDDERGEFVAVDLGEDGEHIGEAAVGDPRLLPVQDVVACRPRRAGPSSCAGSASEPECGSVSA